MDRFSITNNVREAFVEFNDKHSPTPANFIAKYADLSFRPVRERVAILLLDLSSYGEDIIFRKEHSIQQMAAHTATVPVVISRTLGEFRDEGFIESNRDQIIIHRPKALASLALLDFETM